MALGAKWFTSSGPGSGDFLASGAVPMTGALTTINGSNATPAVKGALGLSGLTFGGAAGATAFMGLVADNAEVARVMATNLLIGGTTDGGEKLQVWGRGSFTNSVASDITLLVGSDVSLTSRTTANEKRGIFAFPHYTNTEEPFLFALGRALSASTTLYVGGGGSTGLTLIDVAGSGPAFKFSSGGTPISYMSAVGLRIQIGAAAAASSLFHVAAAGDVSAFRVDDASGAVAMGRAPSSGIKLAIAQASGSQLRLEYDTSNQTTFTINSSGRSQFEAVGSSAYFLWKSDGGTDSGFPRTVAVWDTTALAADVGGGIQFRGIITGAGNADGFAGIRGSKENATDGENGGHLDFYSRANGSNLGLNMRLSAAGNLLLGLTASASSTLLQVNGPGDFRNSSSTNVSLFGSDESLTSRTDATTKSVRIGMPHYTNATSPMGMFYGYSTTAVNFIGIGGGSGAVVAATQINFYAASNNTTTTGTAMVRIGVAGVRVQAGIGGDASALFHVAASADANAFRISDSLGTAAFGGAAISGTKLAIIQASGTQLRLAYDGSNYSGYSVQSDGSLQLQAVGTGPYFQLISPGASTSGLIRHLEVRSNNTLAAGVGGKIHLSGIYTGSSRTPFAAIAGSKANATDGNTEGDCILYAKANGANLVAGSILYGASNRFCLQGALGVGNSTVITTPGAVQREAAVYAADGTTLLGYMVLYAAGS